MNKQTEIQSGGANKRTNTHGNTEPIRSGGASARAAPARSPAQPPARRMLAAGVPIVYEDADVLVVDKPAGLLTAATPGTTAKSLFGSVKEYMKGRAGGKTRGRVARVWIIHRLDKEASGLLVFALSERAFAGLKEDFRNKRVGRLYAAVVEGAFPAAEVSGTVRTYLYEDQRGIVHAAENPEQIAREQVVRTPSRPAPRGGARRGALGIGNARDESESDASASAKIAVTHYEARGASHGRTLVHVRLETGRKNQIRVHMKHLGRPIVGDRRYGAATDPLGRVCLHAMELHFQHPATGKPLDFQSPVPGPMMMLVGGKNSASSVMKSPASPPAPTHTLAPKITPVAGDHAVQTSSTASIAPPGAAARTGEDRGWDHVAGWYDGLVREGRSDHHEKVVLPGVLRLLDAKPGQRVLDVACGEGVLCRLLARLGAEAVGIDAAEKLIASAKSVDKESLYFEGDARKLGAVAGEHGPFQSASCVLALMNIEPMRPVLEGVRGLLVPGGRFVCVMLHPAFRSPGQTAWGWEEEAPRQQGIKASREAGQGKARPLRQFRRVDGYLSAGHSAIVMNPGAAAAGKPAVTTMTYHRPIGAYVQALARAGFVVDALEEWASARVSEPGPRATEENRARREIPMFLAIRALAQ